MFEHFSGSPLGTFAAVDNHFSVYPDVFNSLGILMGMHVCSRVFEFIQVENDNIRLFSRLKSSAVVNSHDGGGRPVMR